LYRYSLVGEVTQVGSNVNATEWVGKRVFSFSPHGTHHITDTSSVMLVPDDISTEDATFLPSVVCCHFSTIHIILGVTYKYM
jgi:NADPH:quinone reductase-like Zn-dependent oxidoreductase